MLMKKITKNHLYSLYYLQLKLFHYLINIIKTLFGNITNMNRMRNITYPYVE